MEQMVSVALSSKMKDYHLKQWLSGGPGPALRPPWVQMQRDVRVICNLLGASLAGSASGVGFEAGLEQLCARWVGEGCSMPRHHPLELVSKPR